MRAAFLHIWDGTATIQHGGRLYEADLKDLATVATKQLPDLTKKTSKLFMEVFREQSNEKRPIEVPTTSEQLCAQLEQEFEATAQDLRTAFASPHTRRRRIAFLLSHLRHLATLLGNTKPVYQKLFNLLTNISTREELETVCKEELASLKDVVLVGACLKAASLLPDKKELQNLHASLEIGFINAVRKLKNVPSQENLQKAREQLRLLSLYDPKISLYSSGGPFLWLHQANDTAAAKLFFDQSAPLPPILEPFFNEIAPEECLEEIKNRCLAQEYSTIAEESFDRLVEQLSQLPSKTSQKELAQILDSLKQLVKHFAESPTKTPEAEQRRKAKVTWAKQITPELLEKALANQENFPNLLQKIWDRLEDGEELDERDLKALQECTKHLQAHGVTEKTRAFFTAWLEEEVYPKLARALSARAEIMQKLSEGKFVNEEESRTVRVAAKELEKVRELLPPSPEIDHLLSNMKRFLPSGITGIDLATLGTINQTTAAQLLCDLYRGRFCTTLQQIWELYNRAEPDGQRFSVLKANALRFATKLKAQGATEPWISWWTLPSHFEDFEALLKWRQKAINNPLVAPEDQDDLLLHNAGYVLASLPKEAPEDLRKALKSLQEYAFDSSDPVKNLMHLSGTLSEMEYVSLKSAIDTWKELLQREELPSQQELAALQEGLKQIEKAGKALRNTPTNDSESYLALRKFVRDAFQLPIPTKTLTPTVQDLLFPTREGLRKATPLAIGSQRFWVGTTPRPLTPDANGEVQIHYSEKELARERHQGVIKATLYALSVPENSPENMPSSLYTSAPKEKVLSVEFEIDQEKLRTRIKELEQQNNSEEHAREIALSELTFVPELTLLWKLQKA